MLEEGAEDGSNSKCQRQDGWCWGNHLSYGVFFRGSNQHDFQPVARDADCNRCFFLNSRRENSWIGLFQCFTFDRLALNANLMTCVVLVCWCFMCVGVFCLCFWFWCLFVFADFSHQWAETFLVRRTLIYGTVTVFYDCRYRHDACSTGSKKAIARAC